MTDGEVSPRLALGDEPAHQVGSHGLVGERADGGDPTRLWSMVTAAGNWPKWGWSYPRTILDPSLINPSAQSTPADSSDDRIVGIRHHADGWSKLENSW